MNKADKYIEYRYKTKQATCAHSYLLSPILDLISEKATSKNQRLRILDLGAGNGSLSNEIAKQGHEVIGVEESPSGVDIARANYPDCKFLQGNIYDLPYEELGNDFDVVIAVEVIEHLLYPRELANSAKKVLRPDGNLIITTPYHGYLKNLALALSGQMDKHFTVLWDGGHIKFFSMNTLTSLLQESGYHDIKFKFAGRLPFLAKSMVCSASLSNN